MTVTPVTKGAELAGEPAAVTVPAGALDAPPPNQLSKVCICVRNKLRTIWRAYDMACLRVALCSYGQCVVWASILATSASRKLSA